MADSFNSYKNTRIAPTPSGYLHLGNVLSFAITASLAQKSGAKILLRIDDLDQARVNKLYVQDIFDTLNFLDIPWHDGPRDAGEFDAAWSQLHRLTMYRDALKTLCDNQKVFACTCSRQQINTGKQCTCFNRHIPLNTPNVCWRLITDNSHELEVKNYNGPVSRNTLPVGMHNFIVKKKDGFPSYQLTSMIDDLFYGTDLVVRGEDLWPSTLAQHELAAALEKTSFNAITFYHHPLIIETPGKKLSKSAGATSIRYLRENGKSAAAIFQLIALALGINETVINWQQLAGLYFLSIS